MKMIIKWVLVLGCLSGGVYLVICAIKKHRHNDQEFKLSHLCKNISISKKSSTQLFIEGFFGIIVGLVGYFFLWD